MSTLRFLSALPAILAFAGFVAYLVLSHFRSDNTVIRRIVDKLRQESPYDRKLDQRLNSRQIEQLLKGDQHLRELVGDQDFKLLRQILHQDFIISIFVYGAILGLCTWSAFLYSRQAEASHHPVLRDFGVTDPNPNANGLLVDLDPIDVSWESTGDPEDAQIYLENIDSQDRSTELAAPAGSHHIEFSPGQYRNILRSREQNSVNRIRVVAQGKNNVFTTEPINLHVGITVLTLVDADSMLTVAAMIDNQRIPFYDFEARIVVPSRAPSASPLSVGSEIPYEFRKIHVANASRFDWDDARGAYFSPDDPRTVHFQFLVDDSLLNQGRGPHGIVLGRGTPRKQNDAASLWVFAGDPTSGFN